MKRLFLLLAAAALLGRPAAAQPATESSPPKTPVVVVLATDYPAFTLVDAPEIARPLRAIVMWQVPGTDGGPVVLLNPSHANAHTLYEALSLVQRRPRDRRFVVLGLSPRGQGPDGSTSEQLRAVLARLTGPDAQQSQVRGVSGTSVTLADAHAYLPAAPGQKRDP